MSDNPFGNPFAEDEEEQQTYDDDSDNQYEEYNEEDAYQTNNNTVAVAGDDQHGDEEEAELAAKDEEGEEFVDEEQHVAADAEEEGDINNQEVNADEEDVPVAETSVECTEQVEERLEEATMEFNAEQFVVAQSTILKLQADNEALTTTNAITSAKLEASEQELQVVKAALAQMQQVMAGAAAAAVATATPTGEGEETTSIPSSSATLITPSFDAVELALELETTDRKLLLATHASERAAALATKWEDEAKRYASMYHDAVAGRYIPLLSDHGATIIAKNHAEKNTSATQSSGAGSRVVDYFSDLLLNGSNSNPIFNDGDDTTFTKTQREVLLDYILACGYELQFMMMRANVMMNNNNNVTTSSSIPAPAIGGKRSREETPSPSMVPTTATPLSPSAIAVSLLPTTGRTISVKQGLLGELVQELTSTSSSVGGVGQRSNNNNKWDFAETQISTASTTTINALRAHVSQFDKMETSVKALNKKVGDARSLSANPLFNLTWNDDNKDMSAIDQQEGEEEMKILRGKNKLLVGACKMYYRRSQQLLVELAQLRASSSATTNSSSTTAAVIGGAIASANIVSAYAAGLDSVRCAYAQTMENIAVGVAAKFATLSTVHNAYLQGVSQEEDEEKDSSAQAATTDIVSDLARFIEVGHQTTFALKQAVVGATNDHLAGPLNAATTQYHRDVAVFARLLVEADEVIQQSIDTLEDGGSDVTSAIQAEQLQVLVEGILHRTPTIVPSVQLPESLTTAATTPSSPALSNVADLVQTVSSQCVSSIVTAHETVSKINNDRMEFTLNKVAALLSSSDGNGGAAQLLRDLQNTQSAHRTTASELSTATHKLNEVNSKLKLALQAHEKAKANCDKEAKSHIEARSMLQNSQSLLSKNQTASLAQLAEQKSKYEEDIAELDGTVQKLKGDFALLEAQLAAAVQETADAIAAKEQLQQQTENAEVEEDEAEDQQQEGEENEEEEEQQQQEDEDAGDEINNQEAAAITPTDETAEKDDEEQQQQGGEVEEGEEGEYEEGAEGIEEQGGEDGEEVNGEQEEEEREEGGATAEE